MFRKLPDPDVTIYAVIIHVNKKCHIL